MSLAIDVDKVTSVLLADGWHVVADASFTIDAYEFLWRGDAVHGGGNSGVCAAGAEWLERKGHEEWVVSCPLTAILAVRQKVVRK